MPGYTSSWIRVIQRFCSDSSPPGGSLPCRDRIDEVAGWRALAKQCSRQAVLSPSRGGEMVAKKSGSKQAKSPTQMIDARIEELGDWRGEMLGRIRALVK